MNTSEFLPGSLALYVLPVHNGGLCISVVEIVSVLPDLRGVAKLRFIKNLIDDSGNGIYAYLCSKRLVDCGSTRFLLHADDEFYKAVLE